MMFLPGGIFRGREAPKGQTLITEAGSFAVPAGVTAISVVGVGRGGTANNPGGAGGGALAYVNGIAVVPGETLTATFDDAGATRLRRGAITLVAAGNRADSTSNAGGAGGGVIVGTGGAGGPGGAAFDGGQNQGGGGAGGYSGAGGAGGSDYESGRGAAGLGGAGGGGSFQGGLGGGVGLLGQGISGAATMGSGDQGNPGSGGVGATYGGGGARASGSATAVPGGPPGIRIIWGAGRAFPNTNTGDVS